MEMLEKVERLVEKANVSYEEAKLALEQTNGDLLDAMVLLERQGKVRRPEQASFSTEYEEQKNYIDVRDKVEEQEQSAPSLGRSVKKFFRTMFRFIKETTFIVSRTDEIFFTMPTMVAVILLLVFWEALFPVMIIALFFGVRYSFDGAGSAETANRVLNRAGDFANDVKNEFTGSNNSGSAN